LDQTNNSYTCQDGGTYKRSVLDVGIQLLSVKGSAENCDVGGVMLDGQVERLAGKVTFTDFQVTDVATGEASFISGSQRQGGELQALTRDLKISSFSGSYNGAIYAVKDLIVEQLVSSFDEGSSHTFEAEMEITQPFSDTEVTKLTTSTLFEASGGTPYFSTGKFLVTTGDNREITLDADTGDDATFALMLTDDSGVTTSALVAWSEAFQLPCIADILGRPGLVGCAE